MRSHHTFPVGIVVTAGMMLATGCGATPTAGPTAPPGSAVPSGPAATAGTATPTGPATSNGTPTGLPTITAPAGPPKEPTDKLPNTGWVSGVITRGGTGPCYGFTAEDGGRYALYNTDGIDLAASSRVKVKLETTLIKIYCGPGKLMAMTAAEPIG
jgi:hypothetical protein